MWQYLQVEKEGAVIEIDAAVFGREILVLDFTRDLKQRSLTHVPGDHGTGIMTVDNASNCYQLITGQHLLQFFIEQHSNLSPRQIPLFRLPMVGSNRDDVIVKDVGSFCSNTQICRTAN